MQKKIPLNPNLLGAKQVRFRERFKVNFSRTKQYQESTTPLCQRLLNSHEAQQQKEREEEESEEGDDGEERGEGEEGEEREESDAG